MDMGLLVINSNKLDIDYNLVKIGNKSLPDYITDILKEDKIMDKFKEVAATKQLRKDIDELTQHAKALDPSRETALAVTKLQEATMWLGMNLKRLGELDPYPESRNPENTIIHPTADGLKL